MCGGRSSLQWCVRFMFDCLWNQELKVRIQKRTRILAAALADFKAIFRMEKQQAIRMNHGYRGAMPHHASIVRPGYRLGFLLVQNRISSAAF